MRACGCVCASRVAWVGLTHGDESWVNIAAEVLFHFPGNERKTKT